MTRLERLLKIRRAGESVERGRWARARLEVEARAGEAGSIAAKRDAVAEDLRSISTGTLNLARLALGAQSREVLQETLETAEMAARAAEELAEARRRELESANRRVRALEKVSGRIAALDKARREAAERRENDDRRRAEAP
ncbi:MAG TPA: hypothetical protein VFT32_06555 [Candidatus Eisenbacteria bacterium]|nr:hypothetical protein [Candidatus Eisenbacteria bacterium]